MGKSLVIVESPTKVKTIRKYLGKDFVVRSSVGHVRDLPVGGGGPKPPPKRKPGAKPATPAQKAAQARKALVRRMGVDPDKDWTATYEVLPSKQKVIDELKTLAADADTIYLATDLDREGEAIAWHLREVIGGAPERFKRVTFAEITKRAIEAAFAEPGELNMDRVNAQQARRFLDRVVGYMVSPVLWKKVARGLSAGRVQSVATRLVVEREREIRAFVPEEYWELHADLDQAGNGFRAQVVRQGETPFKPTTGAETDAAVSALRDATYEVVAREDKPTRSRPAAPFITSTLQQAASVRLGFSVKKTMTVAQRLYESGLITYMRTDATNLSQDAINGCRGFIERVYGADYLPEKPNRYASGDGAQEAHEAIRPTDVRLEPGDKADLDADQARLYDLIWRRFVACQMPPAEFDTTGITIAAAGYQLRARGRVLRFDGWLKVLPPTKKKDDDDRLLPDLAVGDQPKLVELDPTQHFTKPPARFTEASLVGELKKQGIGRPSTYAAIISTIQERGYVRQDRRRLYAEKMGEIVTDRLVENFIRLMEYGFTAELEEELDQVAAGTQAWNDVLNRFYEGFKQRLTKAEEEMRPNQLVATDIECPTCGRHMMIRNARTGVFLSCSGYDLPKKDRCTQTLNLVPGDEAEAVGGDDAEAEVAELRAKRRCSICGAAMDSWLLDEHRKVHICGNNPDCPGWSLETGTFRIKGYDGPVIECDKCGSDMQLRSGRFGKYFACTNDACSNTRKLLRNGEAAPPKMDPIDLPHLPCIKSEGAHFMLRDGASGLFLAAHDYPKHRETRNPLVNELKDIGTTLPEKYHFLLDAPAADDVGNPAVVRFSRKAKNHYVASDNKDGKPSGWSAVFDEQQKTWVASGSAKPVKKTAKKSAAKKSTAKKAAAKKAASDD